MRLISSLTARATTGASNGSSGIHASFAGGGAAFATVTGAGFSLLAQPIATQAEEQWPELPSESARPRSAAPCLPSSECDQSGRRARP